jgi:(p)ppGpp synthase/HD superfamily hydrolase
MNRLEIGQPRLVCEIVVVMTEHIPSVPDVPTLGTQFDEALVYAHCAHRDHQRKGTEIPYVSHLLAVASIVLESGGDEDEAIAALMHDVVEDRGGSTRLADVRARFGDRVARIVEECSDTDVVPKPPWRARKEAYIAHLEDCSPEALRVSLADKLHNARSILADYRQIGDALWARFDPDADTVWYYRALCTAFQAHGANPQVDELNRVVTELERLVQEDVPASTAS